MYSLLFLWISYGVENVSDPVTSFEELLSPYWVAHPALVGEEVPSLRQLDKPWLADIHEMTAFLCIERNGNELGWGRWVSDWEERREGEKTVIGLRKLIN